MLSTPTFMVLKCCGSSFTWCVYAIRLEGADIYAIMRAALHHHCTVDERGDYQCQATTKIIGDMLRSKYVG